MNEHHLDGLRTARWEPPIPAVRVVRGQIAQTMQLQLIDRLMKAMSELVPLGIVPIGFRADLLEGPVLLIEIPADEVIERNRFLVSGRFDGKRPSLMWFMHGYLKVEWEIVREGPRRPRPTLDIEV